MTQPEASGSPGERMRTWMTSAYPICRSISGDGVRATLDLIERALPPEVSLRRTGVPTGTDVFDWTIGEEWNVSGASITGPDGRQIVDFADHNLHLVSYSTPVSARLSLEELLPHLHSLPEHPDWIPYRTSYYHRDWGFCLPHRQLEALEHGMYDVVVDTSLSSGELLYGEVLLPGEGSSEVIISSHVCHPSLANDNMTGLAVAIELIRHLLKSSRRTFSYRFLFAPGTIGSLAWLSQHADVLPRIRHGLVLTGLGGGGPLVYKQTRNADRKIDDAAGHVVGHRGGEVRAYSPYGYDERQFNAVGFDLPVGRLTRTPHGEYPEYHSSADNLDFVTDDELMESLDALVEITEILERDQILTNRSPYGEPQLGKRGLYPTMGGRTASDAVMAMLWTLAYADGKTSLLEIAHRSGVPFRAIRSAADALLGADLLAEG